MTYDWSVLSICNGRKSTCDVEASALWDLTSALRGLTGGLPLAQSTLWSAASVVLVLAGGLRDLGVVRSHGDCKRTGVGCNVSVAYSLSKMLDELARKERGRSLRGRSVDVTGKEERGIGF